MSLNVVSRRASWPQHAVRAGAVQPQGVLPRGPPPHTLPDLHQHWRLPPDRRRPRGSLCLRIWWLEHTPSYGTVFIQTGSWLRRSYGVDHGPCCSSLMWRGSWVMEGICWFGLCFGGLREGRVYRFPVFFVLLLRPFTQTNETGGKVPVQLFVSLTWLSSVGHQQCGLAWHGSKNEFMQHQDSESLLQ